MNVPKIDIKQLLEAGSSWTQNGEMEPKNEEVHFW